ncbi:MAG TPA: type II secretion system protein M [Gallionella sp.]
MNLPDLLKRARPAVLEFWAARAPRERTILGIGATVVVLALVQLILIDPALSGRKKLNRDLPTLRQQLAQLQALGKEAAALSAKPSAPLPAVTRESLETALTRVGLAPQGVTVNGNIVQVKLTSVPFSGLLNWLDEMQKDTQLAVADADITVLPQPDRVDAVLSLRQPAAE